MADEEKKEAGVGVFMDSLTRSNKAIKRDRAESISEDAQMRFRRTIEDMEINLKRMQRERTNMLDLSPENAQSLMLGKDFDSAGFVGQDLELGINMRNLTIELELARERYVFLFEGGE